MREELITRLLNAALRRAQTNRFTLSATLDAELRSFIRNGVDRMTEEQVRSDTRKDEAENNLLYLIELMTQNAQSRRLTESLDISAFTASMSSFCPRFPFC